MPWRQVSALSAGGGAQGRGIQLRPAPPRSPGRPPPSGPLARSSGPSGTRGPRATRVGGAGAPGLRAMPGSRGAAGCCQLSGTSHWETRDMSVLLPRVAPPRTGCGVQRGAGRCQGRLLERPRRIRTRGPAPRAAYSAGSASPSAVHYRHPPSSRARRSPGRPPGGFPSPPRRGPSRGAQGSHLGHRLPLSPRNGGSQQQSHLHFLSPTPLGQVSWGHPPPPPRPPGVRISTERPALGAGRGGAEAARRTEFLSAD